MKIQEHLSLELSQKLAEVCKEKGLEMPETKWYHSNYSLHHQYSHAALLLGHTLCGKGYREEIEEAFEEWEGEATRLTFVPAPSLAELGVLSLPELDLKGRNGGYFVDFGRYYDVNDQLDGWEVDYVNRRKESPFPFTIRDGQEVEARGEMLIYIIENYSDQLKAHWETL